MRYDPFAEEWHVRRRIRAWLCIAIAVGAVFVVLAFLFLVMVHFPP